MFTNALRLFANLILLFAATRSVYSSSQTIQANFAPCGYNFGSWCSFTYDTGYIDAVYHIGPGTPAGWYPVTFDTYTGYPWPGYTAYVSADGVGSPTRIVAERAIDMADQGIIELVTSQGASASLRAQHVYWGQLGGPYDNNPPPPATGDKTAVLDIYINSSPSSPLPPDDGQTGPCHPNTGCPAQAPMAAYSMHLLLANLHLEDRPISYAPPRGPRIDFLAAYNHREANQPAIFDYSNLGPKWTFNWLSYVIDNPADPTVGASVYMRSGGTESYTGYNGGTQSYAADPQSMAVLTKTSANSYERKSPDGSKEVFSLVSGTTFPRRLFLTSIVDPSGNTVSVAYDTNLRISTITDPLGQVTTLSYTLTGDPLKITKVTDPFGRFATFDYTSGQLSKITDPVGIQSQFAYATGTDFINALTTPYGTTSFAAGESGDSYRWVEATDPLGGKERVEYKDFASGVTLSDSVAPPGFYNNDLQVGNTFYWNKKAMADAPGDYSKAQVTHWLKNTAGTKFSGIKSSQKQPLENRIWYKYDGQTRPDKVGTTASPSRVGRVLDDSTTQLSQFEYNSLGNLTKETDPAGRVFSYGYAANGIDLIEKRQTRGTNNELLASYTYNGQHEPLAATDAAHETTTYTYNSYAQLRTITNAKNETTTYAYDRDQNNDGVTDGYLLSVSGPVTGAVTTYSYDAAKRVQTVTDSDGYTLLYAYDSIDRPLSVTYPDTTTKQFKYTKYVNGADTGAMTLDLGASKDRRNRWTYREYNANRQLTKVTDPLGRNTLFGWCSCGALGSITDGNNHLTSFVRDVRGRVTSKVFADTRSTTYVYETTTNRLKSTTDARSQVTHYSYNVDDTIGQITYTDTSGQPLSPPTPSVTFSYDPNYKRVGTMTDGTGATTYTYNPITGSISPGAGQLLSVDGPLLNDTITYTYDELGRELTAAINGVSASQNYDALGRVTTTTNPLGQFTNSYYGVSGRLQSTAYPNGQSANYTYFTNLGDKRLQTILTSGALAPIISKFDYQYDAEGEITRWTRQFGASNPMKWDNGTNAMNDLADQLTSVTERDAITQALRTSYSYGYDNAGNRTSDNGGSYSINTVNQITNSGYTYDNNGSLTSDPWRTYEWDAANRLVAINYPQLGGRSEFTYDGLSRRVKIAEKNASFRTVLQPPDTQYTAYSNTVTLSAGSYTLKLEGLNPNGGDNTVFVDAVTLNATLVPDGSFESPATGSYWYGATGSAWTFAGNSGVTQNGSAFTGSNPNTADGSQVAFVQTSGVASQVVSLSTGSYTLALKAAQRGNGNSSYQTLRVSLEPATPIASTKQFVWIGNLIAEERDASNNISKRFYPQGFQSLSYSPSSTSSYYYSRDHLGSIREVADSTGAVRARYDYDPYGFRSKLSGDVDADFGYTGHYFHAPSGLNLTLCRAYSPILGRWLSRDPIAEKGGLNLFGYVRNDPLNYLDPTGENPVAGALIGLGLGGPVGAVIGAGIGTAVVLIGGAAVYDYVHNHWDTPPPPSDIHLNSNFPPGYWPADRGAPEWGRRCGLGARQGKNRFHGIKQKCPGSRGTDEYGVNPDTGDVIDPSGESVGDLNDAPPK